MRTFEEIIEYLKIQIQFKEMKTRTIKDKEIAKLIELEPGTLASYKNRNKIPYLNLIRYLCKKEMDLKKAFCKKEEK